jgi:pimeloyl-ACP methyl ester carboxylesterase
MKWKGKPMLCRIRSWKKPLRSLLLVYVGVFLFGWLSANRMAFLPPPASYQEGAEVHFVTHPNGERVAFVREVHPEASHVILFAHGNGEDIGQYGDFWREYRDQGFTVYAFDYRGYGQSSGRATIRNAREDILLLYRHLIETEGWDPQKVILHGRSLGSAFVLHLAARHPVGGVILESAFLNGFRTVTRANLFPFDPLPNDRNIRRIQAPVLIKHGQRDSVIPFFHGEALFRLAPEPKYHAWTVAGHDDLFYANPSAYWRAIRDFVKR